MYDMPLEGMKNVCGKSDAYRYEVEEHEDQSGGGFNSVNVNLREKDLSGEET